MKFILILLRAPTDEVRGAELYLRLMRARASDEQAQYASIGDKGLWVGSMSAVQRVAAPVLRCLPQQRHS